MDINNVLVMHHDNIIFDQIQKSFEEKKLKQFSFTLAKNYHEKVVDFLIYDNIIVVSRYIYTCR